MDEGDGGRGSEMTTLILMDIKVSKGKAMSLHTIRLRLGLYFKDVHQWTSLLIKFGWLIQGRFLLEHMKLLKLRLRTRLMTDGLQARGWFLVIERRKRIMKHNPITMSATYRFCGQVHVIAICQNHSLPESRSVFSFT